MTSVDSLIAEAKELSRKRNDEAAMSLANEMVQRYPDEINVWWLRGYLYGVQRKYREAIADFTRVIEINAVEPHFFYIRGTYEFELNQMKMP